MVQANFSTLSPASEAVVPLSDGTITLKTEGPQPFGPDLVALPAGSEDPSAYGTRRAFPFDPAFLAGSRKAARAALQGLQTLEHEAEISLRDKASLQEIEKARKLVWVQRFAKIFWRAVPEYELLSLIHISEPTRPY